ncbi:MAG: hypothetical protein OEW23_19940, partial [Candidatus Aminicenantes bacterium]|nr:hypothetical protein [Candidatus Aminicenantes bacterium]
TSCCRIYRCSGCGWLQYFDDPSSLLTTPILHVSSIGSISISVTFNYEGVLCYSAALLNEVKGFPHHGKRDAYSSI